MKKTSLVKKNPKKYYIFIGLVIGYMVSYINPHTFKKFNFDFSNEINALSNLKAFIQDDRPSLESFLPQQQGPIGNSQCCVCFTPNPKCQKLIITTLRQAKRSIYVQAYSFTDPEIVQALLYQASKGIKVFVLLDKSNKQSTIPSLLINHHIQVRFDSPKGIAHNKVMILDEETVITGSYNFSKAAYLRNTENVLFLKNKELATTYLKNWHDRWHISSSVHEKIFVYPITKPTIQQANP